MSRESPQNHVQGRVYVFYTCDIDTVSSGPKYFSEIHSSDENGLAAQKACLRGAIPARRYIHIELKDT